MKIWKFLDKLGVGGAVVTALCCLGFPALVSVLTALGLAFLINDAVLQPLLLVFLALSVVGLALGWRRHGKPWAFLVGLVAGAALYVFIFVAYMVAAAYFAVAGLVAASVLNVVLARDPKQKSEPVEKGKERAP
jgi:mercuric ion transport protein